MTRATIFDLDGTLADSEPAHERAIGAVAERHGMRLDIEAFRGRFVGLGEVACFEILTREHGLEATAALLDRLVGVKLELFHEMVGRGEVRPFAGAIPLLERAVAAGPVGLCSASPRVSVLAMLGAIGVAGRFGAVVTADEVARRKPDPEGYLLAARLLGVEPARCTAVEDSPTGVAAARAAGMRVIAVGHSFPAGRLAEADEFAPTIADVRL